MLYDAATNQAVISPTYHIHIVDRVGGDLTPENRAVFYEVLASVTANLEKLCKEI